jgi:benzoyl-CoA reductase/2-hydroxyglutaryl-CoA dehydratase subunit BcrC/BadD/HgdB
MDDISVGSKLTWADVEETDDPIEGIARYYLKKVPLPTFYRGGEVDYKTGLELRFGYLRRFISEFRVDGVVLLVYRNCDPYGLEVPAVVSYVESTGTPVFYVEDDYSASSPARLRTRIEAFLEILSEKRK